MVRVAYRAPHPSDDAPMAVTDNDSFEDLEDDFPIIGTCTALYSFDGEFGEWPLILSRITCGLFLSSTITENNCILNYNTATDATYAN